MYAVCSLSMPLTQDLESAKDEICALHQGGKPLWQIREIMVGIGLDARCVTRGEPDHLRERIVS